MELIISFVILERGVVQEDLLKVVLELPLEVWLASWVCGHSIHAS